MIGSSNFLSLHLLQVILAFCCCSYISDRDSLSILLLWNSVGTTRQVKPVFAQRDLRSASSINEHTRVCTCTANSKKIYFHFLKKLFLSLNRHIFGNIGVFVLVFTLSFHYSIILTSSRGSFFPQTLNLTENVLQKTLEMALLRP